MKPEHSPPMLVAFRCDSNAGYAMAHLEDAFLSSAQAISGDLDRIHFSYTSLGPGAPKGLPPEVRVLAFNPVDATPEENHAVSQYIRRNGIRIVLGFDFPVHAPTYRALRASGVQAFCSYWGAPMSSPNSGLKLLAKRVEVALRIHRPDTFIFESRAMQMLASRGRGIALRQTRLCPTGVDDQRFVPEPEGSTYVHDQLDIPRDRRIILYSGHMEERKGVSVLIRAAIELIDRRGRSDIHLVLLGDRPGESAPYLAQLEGSKAARYVRFAGYRDDIHRLMGSSYIGVIPSTGWDSFPMSALEMGSAGLPVIGSRLHGIPETLAEGETGLLFPPGDHMALADSIASLLDNTIRHGAFRLNARQRIREGYTRRHQLERLTGIIRETAIARGVLQAG